MFYFTSDRSLRDGGTHRADIVGVVLRWSSVDCERRGYTGLAGHRPEPLSSDCPPSDCVNCGHHCEISTASVRTPSDTTVICVLADNYWAEQDVQEAQLLLGDRATQKHAKDS